jgi:hypothetical protein
MSSEVVHNHDLSAAQSGGQHLLDVRFKLEFPR